MSYDLKLNRVCDHKILNEIHIVDYDNVSIYPHFFVASNLTLNYNNAELLSNAKIESYISDDISDQCTTPNSAFVVTHAPIYNNLNLRLLAQNTGNIKIRIKVIDEDNSSQFTGLENYLITQHKPILSENFSFSVSLDDVLVKVNGSPVPVLDVDSQTGRITFNIKPLSTDIVTASYYYSATIDSFNAKTGVVKIKEKPFNQEVIAYYPALVKNGWDYISTDSKLIFQTPKRTNRIMYTDNFSLLTDGIKKTFQFTHYPILPREYDYYTTYKNTFPKDITITLNGVEIKCKSLDAEKGELVLYTAPEKGSTLTVNYIYQSEDFFDYFTISYVSDINHCPKCNSLGTLDDLEYDPSGKLVTVEDEAKLAQDMRKMIITIQGSNKDHPWFGTTLETLIGQKYPKSYVETHLTAEIMDVGDNIKNLQTQQSNYQNLTTREQLNSLVYVNTSQDTNDQSFWKVNVGADTKATTTIKVNEIVQI